MLLDCRKGPNLDSIEAYVDSVRKMILDNPEEHQQFLAQVRNAAAKVRLS